MTTNLKAIRQKLKLTQEGLARRTRSLTIGTVKNAESGKRITYDTATQILTAVNEVRQERGESALALDDLGLSLY